MLAHAGSVPETLGVVLLVGAAWIAWIGWSRLRNRGFRKLPAAAAYGTFAVAVGLVVAAAYVPQVLFPQPAVPTGGPRPSSTASISFDRPRDGQRVRGDELDVVLTLTGGTVVTTTTSLSPDTGHIHLSLDGQLVSMTYGTVQVVDLTEVGPGPHALEAEFVAADHAPFDPRVTARVTFTKVAGP